MWCRFSGVAELSQLIYFTHVFNILVYKRCIRTYNGGHKTFFFLSLIPEILLIKHISFD